jgi:MFS family permease
MTYEGARGINGPFLGSLGASAAIIGTVAGAGELAGYGLRAVVGYFADKTRAYWILVVSGYVINLLAVPALALAGNWPVAAALMIAERTGRAIRRPPTEAMISHAGESIGHGWAFGLSEALDQTGATIGPLLTAWVLYQHGGYHHAYAVLLIPALLCLATLLPARAMYPRPQALEHRPVRFLEIQGFSKSFWLYLGAAGLIAAGYADFSLVAFHFQKADTVAPPLIPVFYAGAMISAALASLVYGRFLDRLGISVLLPAFLLPALSAPFVFLGGPVLAAIGVFLWGTGMGAQDSCLKAALSRAIPVQNRSTAFGVFDTGFGIAWFLGSVAMGLLYEKSIPALVIFSMLLQLAALPVLAWAGRRPA